MEGGNIVRAPLRARERSSRTLDQRLAIRFPRVARAYLRLVFGLRPGSRIRRFVLWRLTRLGVEAYNRRDLDAVVAGWHPDCEYRPDRDWVAAGLVEESYRGPAEYRRYVATVDEVWGGENVLRPVELIDLGDRFLTLAHGAMTGQASGVPLTEAYALVSTVEHGSLVRHQEHYDHARALAAVGLSK